MKILKSYTDVNNELNELESIMYYSSTKSIYK
jgi:hypothetical protein